MSVRSDVTYDMGVSPRIIQVDSPSTEISLQDLHDTVVFFEDSLTGTEFPRLILSAGKEALGGGVSVGITSTLQDAVLSFEARGGPSFVQCDVSGGNLVAVDVNDIIIDPIKTTAFTQVLRTLSSSATLLRDPGFKKGVAVANFEVPLVLVSDTNLPALGLSISCEVNIDGAGFNPIAGTVTEVGLGWYKHPLTAAEMNGRSIALQYTGTGAVTANIGLRTNE